MTKTLTEQWKDGTLEKRQYYFKTDGSIRIGTPFGKNMVLSTDESYVDEDEVEEVLAPVPSYEEYKELQEQVNKQGIWHTDISFRKLEAENKRLQEQLNEANEVVKLCGKDGLLFQTPEGDYFALKEAGEYLKKWGVK